MKQSIPSSFSFIEPMKALPVQGLPEGDWLYEVKHDGYRALVFKDGKDVRLVSRNNKDPTKQPAPELAPCPRKSVARHTPASSA
jgi:ATP-dependent DNA ligase